MKKINEFSFIKFYSVLSIISAHLSPISSSSKICVFFSFLYDSIGVLGVPLFFMISGFLYFNNKRNFKESILIKVKILAIPWFFVGLLVYVFVFVFQNNWSISGLFYFLIGYKSYLYYLTVLFIYFFIYYKLKNNLLFLNITSLLSMLSIILTCIYSINSINSFSYLNIFNWMIYFNTGIYINKFNLLKCIRNNSRLFYIPMIGVILALVMAYLLNLTVNYWSIAGLIIIMLNSIFVWLLSFNRNLNCKCVDYVSKNSLCFYLIHMPIAGVIVRFSNSSILIPVRLLLTFSITYFVIYIYDLISSKLNSNFLKLMIGIKK